MKRAIGVIEIKNIARGFLVADAMLKAANVELLMANSLCPGKFIVMVAGDVGAVQNAVRSGRAAGGAESIVDETVISNIHDDILKALSGSTEVKKIRALGIIETYSVASAIAAADAAAKSAAIELLEVRLARGMGGKSTVSLTGEVGSVTAAVRAAITAIQDSGYLVDHIVLPAPHNALHQALF